MSKSSAIVVLAKNPQIGKVKTRLAKTMGNEAALAVYKELYQGTLQLVDAFSEAKPYIYQSPEIDESLLSSNRASLCLQSDGDLGDRMRHALRETLSHHSKVALIGADCPGLTADILHRALQRLDKVDLVLGPTEDGGFYLLACKKNYENLFLNRSWSHDRVFAETIDIAARLHLDLYLLPELYDIDFESDWKRWRKRDLD